MMKHGVGGLFETKAEETAQHCHILYLPRCLIRGQLSGRTRVDVSKGSNQRVLVNTGDTNRPQLRRHRLIFGRFGRSGVD